MEDMMKIRKAIIPAAGLGTRFLPATKAVPKEMFPIVDKPAIQYIVEEAKDAGITDIIIITSKGKNAIEDHFNGADYGVNIYYARQGEPKGLAGAVYAAKSFVGDEPFAVLLGDVVTLYYFNHSFKKMIDEFEKCNSSIIGIKEVKLNEVSKYGIAKLFPFIDTMTMLYKVHDLVEKPKIGEVESNDAIVGRYVLTPDIFEAIEEMFTMEMTNEEYQLTDALKLLIKKKNVYARTVYEEVYDIGSRLGFLQASIDFAVMRNDLKEDFINYFRKTANV